MSLCTVGLSSMLRIFSPAIRARPHATFADNSMAEKGLSILLPGNSATFCIEEEEEIKGGQSLKTDIVDLLGESLHKNDPAFRVEDDLAPELPTGIGADDRYALLTEQVLS